MDPYYVYTPEELAADPSFINWVRQSDTQDCEFWENWLVIHPERVDVCLQAKSLVLAVHLIHQADELPLYIVQQHIQELVSLAEASKTQHATSRRFLGSLRWLGWQVAAAVLLLVGGFGLYSVHYLTQKGPVDQSALTLPTQVTRTNSQTNPMTILLSDGSVVTLSPKSSIAYPRVFALKQRLVHLEGEAFFDITKNPDKPFFVLTDRSITKVVGTSFRVRAFKKEPAVNVFVRTGKVAVYPVAPRTEQSLVMGADKGILLMPNQQVEVKEGRLKKENVTRHELIAATPVGPSEITFDNQPVGDVLLTLARLYEIPIEFDRQKLADCRITTSFAEETLSERLRSICRAINATFTIDNETITVNSTGCSSPH